MIQGNIILRAYKLGIILNILVAFLGNIILNKLSSQHLQKQLKKFRASHKIKLCLWKECKNLVPT